MTQVTTFTVFRDDAYGNEFAIELDIIGTIDPHVEGRYAGPPESCYPAEGGFAYDCEATLQWSPTVNVWDALTPNEQEQIERALYQAYEKE